MTVRQAREARSQNEEVSASWTIQDYLLALQARLQPMQIFGHDLLSACIRAFRSLWPEEETPKSADILSQYLMESEERLDEWRESAARAGADEALTFVLSWDEDIPLESLQSLRDGSKWMTDPELVKERQKRAYAIAQYANTHRFIPDPEAGTSGHADDDAEDEDEAASDAGLQSPPHDPSQ